MISWKAARLRRQLLTFVMFVVSAFVLAGARTNEQGDALIKAASDGDMPRVKVLFADKVDVNAKANDGTTALMMASQNGHLDVVRMLVDARAAVNAKRDDGTTALMMALDDGHLLVVQELIYAKANVNAKRDDGVTALMLAARITTWMLCESSKALALKFLRTLRTRPIGITS